MLSAVGLKVTAPLQLLAGYRIKRLAIIMNATDVEENDQLNVLKTFFAQFTNSCGKLECFAAICLSDRAYLRKATLEVPDKEQTQTHQPIKVVL
jgi:hypothetical protein